MRTVRTDGETTSFVAVTHRCRSVECKLPSSARGRASDGIAPGRVQAPGGDRGSQPRAVGCDGMAGLHTAESSCKLQWAEKAPTKLPRYTWFRQLDRWERTSKKTKRDKTGPEFTSLPWRFRTQRGCKWSGCRRPLECFRQGAAVRMKATVGR